MKVIAHHGIAQYRTGKKLSQFGNLAFNPWFSMFKGFLQIAIPAAEPRTPNTARNAMIGSGVVDADDVFAGLGLKKSLPHVARWRCQILW